MKMKNFFLCKERKKKWKVKCSKFPNIVEYRENYFERDTNGQREK